MKKKKALSILLVIALVASVTACAEKESSDLKSVDTSSEIENNDEASLLLEVMGQVIPSHSSSAGKDETVYVFLDADGENANVIVSEQLKNKNGTEKLNDETLLTDIVNVNGYGNYTENSDGTITWDAMGSDIFYRGTTDKELPVNVSISYTLDGQSISASELAGKSGRVKIRFDYENNTKTIVTVDDDDYEVNVPFMIVSGLIMPNDNFTNVEVTNGKVVGEGSNQIVVGLAYPGLRESLDWDSILEKADNKDTKDKLSDVNFPEYVEIEADATDFELGMTMSIAGCNLFSQIDIEDSLDLSEIQDKMDELSNGTNELVYGAKKLSDGTGDLLDGVIKLKDGSLELYDGTAKLKDGIVDYTDGADKLYDGSRQLYDGAVSAKNGSSQLRSGFYDNDIAGNARKLATGAAQVSDGVNLMVNKLNTLPAQIAELTKLKTMLGDFASAMETCLGNDSYAVGGFTQTLLGYGHYGASEYNAVLNSFFSSYYSLVPDGYKSPIGVCEACLAGAHGFLGAKVNIRNIKDVIGYDYTIKTSKYESYISLYADGNQDDDDINILNNDNDNYDDVNDTSESAEKPAPDTTLIPSETSAPSEAPAPIVSPSSQTDDENITDDNDDSDDEDDEDEDEEDDDDEIKGVKLKALDGPLRVPVPSASSVADGYKEKCITIQATCAGASKALAQVLATLSDMDLSQLQALSSGAVEVAAGADKLANGLGTLGSGISALDDGLSSLQNGTYELYSGAGTLVSNNGDLIKGANDLKDGAYRLDDGARELYDGSLKLDDGTSELLTGVIKLDEEGMQKITDLLGDDATDVLNRFKAVKQAGADYTSFTGALGGDDYENTVKFIYKTGAVEAE